MRARTRTAWLMLGLMTSATGMPNAWAQGSLTPPGAPAATMRTLEQMEPRTPISSAPYTISQQGSYYLTANLTSTGHGVVIAASGVTLDLMGFTLAGDRSGDDYGVLLDGTTNAPIRDVIVRNGAIKAFGYGVNAKYSFNARFERLTASSNAQYGVFLHGNRGQCDGNAIVDCDIGANRLSAVIFGGSFGQCNNNTLAHCTINGNGGAGLYLDSFSGRCMNNRIVDCAIGGNGEFGVCFWSDNGQCNGNAIARCAISGNTTNGVYFNGTFGRCEGNMLADCAISGNGAYGIHLFGVNGRCDGNSIARCTINGNGNFGVALDGRSGQCDGNTLVNCTIQGNAARGIYLYAADGNRVEANHVSGQTGTATYGIHCTNTAQNLILRNTCVGQTNNFVMSASDTYGPIVTSAGSLATNGAPAHPWANFSR